MIIFTNSKNKQAKTIAKKLSILFLNSKFYPRGKITLKKIIEKAKYDGANLLCLCSKKNDFFTIKQIQIKEHENQIDYLEEIKIKDIIILKNNEKQEKNKKIVFINNTSLSFFDNLTKESSTKNIYFQDEKYYILKQKNTILFKSNFFKLGYIVIK